MARSDEVTRGQRAKAVGITIGPSRTKPLRAGNVPVDAGLPNAPVIGVIQPSPLTLRVGILPPGSPSNWNTVYGSRTQVAFDDITFAAPEYDEDQAGIPPDNFPVTVGQPGTHYVRSLVHNDLGDSPWSSIFTIEVGFDDAFTIDTDLPGEVVNLAITTKAAGNNLAGNEFEISFELPITDMAGYWGFDVYAMVSSSFPTSTKADSGTAGSIVAGSTRLTDLTKSWTPAALIGKWITVYSDKSAFAWEEEGQIMYTTILDNGADWIDVNMQAYGQERTMSGLTYYIMDTFADTYRSKLKLHREVIDEYALGQSARNIRKTVRFVSGDPVINVWVSINNLFGVGELAGPVNATFPGIQTAEYKLLSVSSDILGSDSVITSKITALNVTAGKISVTSLSAITADLGTITAGTITGATIRTSASNPKVEMNGTQFLSVNSGGTTVVTIDGNSIKANLVQGITAVGNAMEIRSSDGTTGIFADASEALVQIGAVTRFRVTASLLAFSGTTFVNATGLTGNGSQLTTLSGTNISSGTVADARLSSNIPLKNASNTFAAAQVISSGGLTITSADITFTAGRGIVAGGTAVAVNTSNVECYTSSTLRATFGTDTSISIAGTRYTLTRDGSGFVKA